MPEFAAICESVAGTPSTDPLATNSDIRKSWDSLHLCYKHFEMMTNRFGKQVTTQPQPLPHPPDLRPHIARPHPAPHRAYAAQLSR